MNRQQETAYAKLVRGYIQELGIGGYAPIFYGVITKVIEAKTIDQKLIALDYLLKTITDNKRED